jgi:hypothetical protein
MIMYITRPATGKTRGEEEGRHRHTRGREIRRATVFVSVSCVCALPPMDPPDDDPDFNLALSRPRKHRQATLSGMSLSPPLRLTGIGFVVPSKSRSVPAIKPAAAPTKRTASESSLPSNCGAGVPKRSPPAHHVGVEHMIASIKSVRSSLLALEALIAVSDSANGHCRFRPPIQRCSNPSGSTCGCVRRYG